MTPEPDSRKKPDDEREKDDLLDDSIEDIDLDALLADDGPLPAEPVVRGESSTSASSDVIDDGEIDLTAEESDADVISADDLLDLEDPVEEGANRAFGAEGQAVRMDSATNGRPEEAELSNIEGSGRGSEDSLQSGGESAEAEEEIAAFDLLADLPEADPLPSEVRDDLAFEEKAREPSVAAEEVTASFLSEEETVSLSRPVAPIEEEEAAAAAAPSAPSKKRGRLGAGKPAKLVKKKEPKGAGPARKGKETPKAEPAEKKVAVLEGAVRGSIPFVCSECYEEFLIPSNYPHEMVSCPECLHVGKRPDADFIRTIHLHKAVEKRSLTAAVACGALLLAIAVSLVWLTSPFTMTGKEAGSSPMAMVLLVAGGLLTILLVWLVVRFEGNRWEVYF